MFIESLEHKANREKGMYVCHGVVYIQYHNAFNLVMEFTALGFHIIIVVLGIHFQ